MKKYDVVIIGGGAAGLMAAGAAAQAGAKVALFEKMNQTGRKIGISGKGRCNISNSADLPDFIKHFGKNGKFLRQAFSRFFSEELVDLIESLGVDVTLERGGRFFPTSGKALDVVQALNIWIEAIGVSIYRSTPVKEILTKDGKVTAIIAGGEKFSSKQIIIATGGLSYPRTGSTGDGYRFAKELGHTVSELHPALVPLVSKDPRCHELAGLDLRNVETHLLVANKRKASYFGEISFTEFGISGPSTLSLSSMAVEALNSGEKVAVQIDLKPALSYQKLDARLIRDLTQRHGDNIKTVLGGLLPKKLIGPCLEECEIAPQTAAGTFPAVLRKKILHWLKERTIEISGFRSYDEAIVTAGGVSLKEIQPKSMESKKVAGLYIAGEALDLHADTGGYNLQAAFSTGWLAGKSAAAASQDEK